MLLQADLNDTASLKKALKDAYAVFAVTNYWESQSVDVEVKQGKSIADAAKVGSQDWHFRESYSLQYRMPVFSILSGVLCSTSPRYLKENSLT